MPAVTVHATAPSTDADQVFRTICDFGRYPALTTSVREVEVLPVEPGVVDSRWTVEFRSGLLKWCERDHIDADRRCIDFVQTAGDFDAFSGAWTVEQDGSDTRIVFRASFDLGMPTLAPIIDPIATSTLVQNIEVILRGLLAGAVAFSRAADPAGTHTATTPVTS